MEEINEKKIFCRLVRALFILDFFGIGGDNSS
jgi:hypothetical protein